MSEKRWTHKREHYGLLMSDDYRHDGKIIEPEAVLDALNRLDQIENALAEWVDNGYASDHLVQLAADCAPKRRVK